MNILAFDTCFDACSVAIASGLTESTMTVRGLFEPMKKGQAERLLPMIGEVLAQSRLDFGDIDLICVSNGPGTFTGTRIAVSAARALALALGRPIVALSSLEMMARHPDIGPLEAGRQLAVAVDANRAEVYLQRFDGATRVALSSPVLLNYDQAARSLGSVPVVIAGSGSQMLAASAHTLGIDAEARAFGLLPRAEDAVAATFLMPALAEPLRPLYLRPPDAKPQLGKSLARAP